jgi:hypothetical protein
MSLNQGAKTNDLDKIWWQNYDRLLIWCNVGADVKNGIYSMLGAREGAYLTNFSDWDYANVRDFEYLTGYWKDQGYDNLREVDAEEECVHFGTKIKTNFDLELSVMDADSSRFFKAVYQNTPRVIRRK